MDGRAGLAFSVPRFFSSAVPGILDSSLFVSSAMIVNFSFIKIDKADAAMPRRLNDCQST
ncbi:MAG: hypothetical protein RR893_14350 [Clostridia bacterium]